MSTEEKKVPPRTRTSARKTVKRKNPPPKVDDAPVNVPAVAALPSGVDPDSRDMDLDSESSEKEEGLVDEPSEESPPNDPDPPLKKTRMDTGTNDSSNVSVAVSNLLIIQDAVKYSGFNPERLRDTFVEGKTPVQATQDLITVFTAYSHIGNNIGKLGVKRVDTLVSRDVLNSVKEMGVVKKASIKDSLTLPRLAIAFMPFYFLYRKYFTSNLQDQTVSQIPVEYKDIVFYGCEEVRSMPGYLQYHKEFSSLIYNPKQHTSLDDQKFGREYDRWNKVAIDGYKSDPYCNENMPRAINFKKLTPLECYNEIMRSLEEIMDE